MKSVLRLIAVFLIFLPSRMDAQGLIINAAAIEGIGLNRENVFDFQIISNLPKTEQVNVEGTIYYREKNYKLSYSLTMRLTPGVNSVNRSNHITWTYSSNAVKELFQYYNTLPYGSYRYCIQVTPHPSSGEGITGNAVEECIYNRNQELFLINLIEPENNAKIYERNPVFTWVANCTFANNLRYKFKVVEIQKSQNTENALTRNNPVYQEANLIHNSLIYPVTARVLETYQPYGWTVDAYYKDILLGGAESWRFTIIEDSLPIPVQKNLSYLDIMNENGVNTVFAIKVFKFKYTLSDRLNDVLKLKLFYQGNEMNMKVKELKAVRGDNKFDLDFTDTMPLKHKKKYELHITNSIGKEFVVSFIYLNPDFL